MADWYFVRDGERRGPISLDVLSSELENGLLEWDALVWTEGMGDWVPAETVPALKRPGSESVGGVAAAGGDPFDAAREVRARELTGVEYAGFWKRFAAILIDSLLLMLVLGAVLLAGFAVIAVISEVSEVLANLIGGIGYLAIQIVPYIYFAYFESGPRQATIGKMAMGIKVTDMEGNRISFWRALGRNAGKILSQFLMIGYIMAAFTERKQGLHDMIASCLVIDA